MGPFVMVHDNRSARGALFVSSFRGRSRGDGGMNEQEDIG